MTVHYTRSGEGPPLLLLHATLSSSRQLRTLAARLSQRWTVISVDRRGSGESMTDEPAMPIDVAVHVADLLEIMEAQAIEQPALVGHSYGGCVALELAARHPDRAGPVFVFEPPYGPVAPPEVRAGMAEVGRRTLQARDRGDLEAAALVFIEGVSGSAAVEALSPGARARIGRAGQGAVADATLLGMEPDGLGRITSPVRIATGGASPALYDEIAVGLVARIPDADHVILAGLDHMAPVLQPDRVALAIDEFLQA